MDELIKLSKEEISKELKKARKLQKKEAKELKKMMEREKRRREPTPDEERGHADDEGRWDLHKKNLEIEQDMLDVCLFLFIFLGGFCMVGGIFLIKKIVLKKNFPHF